MLDAGKNDIQIAAQQRATNQATESQTSTSFRFMVGLPDDIGLAAKRRTRRR